MRKFISVIACIVFILVLIPNHALSQDTKSKYDIMLQSLLERVKSKDPSLGDVKVASKAFKELRYAYTETSQYNPYGGIKAKIGGNMLAAVNNKEYKNALEYAEKILKEDYVDIDAHLVASTAYMEAGNQEKSDYHWVIVSMLFLSMSDGGNGDKPETAIEVISVDEEYSVLKLAGLKKRYQALLQINGHNYDRLTVVDPVSSKTFEMYFCIDKPLNWYQNSLKKGD